jgi:hypothetical protein
MNLLLVLRGFIDRKCLLHSRGLFQAFSEWPTIHRERLRAVRRGVRV